MWSRGVGNRKWRVGGIINDTTADSAQKLKKGDCFQMERTP